MISRVVYAVEKVVCSKVSSIQVCAPLRFIFIYLHYTNRPSPVFTVVLCFVLSTTMRERFLWYVTTVHPSDYKKGSRRPMVKVRIPQVDMIVVLVTGDARMNQEEVKGPSRCQGPLGDKLYTQTSSG